MSLRRGILAVAALGLLAGCGGGSDAGDGGSETPSVSPSRSASASPSASPTSASPSASPPSASSSASVSTRFPTYVALGDSYTAAPGVPTTETDDGCLRSSGNYPHLLATALGSRLTDVSCSGASTTSLVGVDETRSAQVAPQFDALSQNTSLVTVGIGGNDQDLFSTAVFACVGAAPQDPTGSPCRDAESQDGTDRLLAKIPTIRGLVTAALRGVHDRAPRATVVLVGYPQPVPASGTCAALPLATGDYPYLRQVFTALDDALRTAAQHAHAHYVDVAAASAGHDICAADPWVNGASDAPGRAIAFHPFAEEQQAVAGLIAQSLGAS